MPSLRSAPEAWHAHIRGNEDAHAHGYQDGYEDGYEDADDYQVATLVDPKNCGSR